jgi:hypothetical protein
MRHPPLLLRQSDAGTGLSRIPEAYENGIGKSGIDAAYRWGGRQTITSMC